MARLSIRNLPDDVHRCLRIRAAQAGRSMEAEAREIITAAVMADSSSSSSASLQSFVEELYRGSLPENVVEDFLRERREEAKKEC